MNTPPQFVLIDHSLSGPGSHHYEYASHILRAADELGYQTVLACNLRFRERVGLPATCRVLPLFRYSTYGGNSLAGRAMNAAVKPDVTGLLSRCRSALGYVRDWRRRLRHQRRLAAFATSCQRLFGQLTLRPGDQVFVPTLSDFDLLALSDVVPSVPWAPEVDWHLQCHFSFLEGRETDYAWQDDRLHAMRDRFRVALQPLRGLRTNFYSTTAQMAAQYNRLGHAEFAWLPYPVNGQFRPLTRHSSPRPLRIVCAGGFRDEKGSRAVADLIESMWADYVEPGLVQFVLQGQTRDLRRTLRREFVTATNAEIESGDWPIAGIVQAPFPLSTRGYELFIRSADVGLFLYDSYRYYGRCSGVLVEMLCAGVPVVVPAGCWLHDEVAAAISSYADQAAAGRQLGIERLNVEQAAAGPETAHETAVEIPAGSGAAVIRVDAPRWRSPRRYFCIEASQIDSAQVIHQLGRQVVTATELSGPTSCCIPLAPSGGTLRLRLWNAFEASAEPIRNLNLTFVARDAPIRDGVRSVGDSQRIPRGAVGAVYAEGQVAEALVEMVRHHAHYRGTADLFSVAYGQLHRPQHAVQLLVG